MENELPTYAQSTHGAAFWLDDAEILHLVILPVTQRPEDAHATVAAVQDLLAGRRVPFLLDTRQANGAMSSEVRTVYATSPLDSLTSHRAVMVGSLVSLLVARVIIFSQGQHIPTKVFRLEEDALQWLGHKAQVGRAEHVFLS